MAQGRTEIGRETIVDIEARNPESAIRKAVHEARAKHRGIPGIRATAASAYICGHKLYAVEIILTTPGDAGTRFLEAAEAYLATIGGRPAPEEVDLARAADAYREATR